MQESVVSPGGPACGGAAGVAFTKGCECCHGCAAPSRARTSPQDAMPPPSGGPAGGGAAGGGAQHGALHRSPAFPPAHAAPPWLAGTVTHSPLRASCRNSEGCSSWLQLLAQGLAQTDVSGGSLRPCVAPPAQPRQRCCLRLWWLAHCTAECIGEFAWRIRGIPSVAFQSLSRRLLVHRWVWSARQNGQSGARRTRRRCVA